MHANGVLIWKREKKPKYIRIVSQLFVVVFINTKRPPICQEVRRLQAEKI
jgi:hypothetical protein